ncbi:MAG: NUDIX hydrolase [Cyclobacteriaceae bacterium]|nr:NUDIX hydrolase [Cyclobacteriaceae bacterium HetDA_MAG_MS6]
MASSISSETEASSIYTGKVRSRVCGIHIQNDSVLLLRHEGLGQQGFIWSPPGGGIEFGETVEEALIKEFQEETGLTIAVKNYLFSNIYIDSRHHAVELFFEVIVLDGSLILGADPELAPQEQMLKEARYVPFSEIDQIHPANRHHAFNLIDNSSDILSLTGFHQYKNL